MTEYYLYKEPISLDTLYIVQYLHSIGIDLLPTLIIERNHNMIDLPSIVSGGAVYSGFDQVVKFYETVSGVNNLLVVATKWKSLNPNYRINDYK